MTTKPAKTGARRRAIGGAAASVSGALAGSLKLVRAPLLQVEGVSKSFGALAAVDDISFTLDAGQILGIAGPNGAGKTTLFNLITGALFAADKGR